MNDSVDGGRVHALDALRAFVLLLGIAFHGALSEVLPPTGIWAVGTWDPSLPLWWFIFSAHLFRMEVFFVLAGFFACLTLRKRGAAAFLSDRFMRVTLVLVILLYPLKFLDSAIWIEGGLKTGWLHVPPDVEAWGPWRIARYALGQEKFPVIHLNHLWFLYFLSIISVSFVAVRAGALRWMAAPTMRLATAGDALLAKIFRSAMAPVWLGIPLGPILAMMDRYDVDTPDKSLVPMARGLAIYGYFFILGWWVCRNQQLLAPLKDRWKVLLGTALVLSFAGWIADYHLSNFGETPNVRAAAIIGNAITIGAAVLGFVGFALRFFSAPSAVVKYLADASYWTYLIHLPIVVAAQVYFSGWTLSGARFAVASMVTLAACLATYQLLVRHSWIGRWLRGRALAPGRG